MCPVPYQVDLSPAAERQLAKLPRDDQTRLVAAMESLKAEPRPAGARKVQGQENTFRLRVGSYRIIYDVYDRVLWVLVLKEGHRKKVYQGELVSQAVRELIAKKLRK